MEHIFYILAIFPIIYEFTVFKDSETYYEFLQEINSKKETLSSELFDSLRKIMSIFMPIYILWCIIGLFSSQWILFLLLVILSLVFKDNTEKKLN